MPRHTSLRQSNPRGWSYWLRTRLPPPSGTPSRINLPEKIPLPLSTNSTQSLILGTILQHLSPNILTLTIPTGIGSYCFAQQPLPTIGMPYYLFSNRYSNHRKQKLLSSSVPFPSWWLLLSTTSKLRRTSSTTMCTINWWTYSPPARVILSVTKRIKPL